MEHPQTLDAERRARYGGGEAVLDQLHRFLADASRALIGRKHAASDIRVGQFREEFVGGSFCEIGRRMEFRLPVSPAVDHTPDASTGPIASRMGEGHFIVADDA